jgi:hypothetical protein
MHLIMKERLLKHARAKAQDEPFLHWWRAPRPGDPRWLQRLFHFLKLSTHLAHLKSYDLPLCSLPILAFLGISRVFVSVPLPVFSVRS